MLYDFGAFINHHPGGAFWLEVTRGTDITEAFEAHHLTSLPSQMLGKYAIRPTKTERNCKLTFHKNGFYLTLKSKVMKVLGSLDQTPKQKTYVSFLIYIYMLSNIIYCFITAHSFGFIDGHDNIILNGSRFFKFNMGASGWFISLLA